MSDVIASPSGGIGMTGHKDLRVAILLRKSELATISQSGLIFAFLGSKLPHQRQIYRSSKTSLRAGR
jgi:hypothetical protein